jgi:polyisoprenyl-teichoic acid--peptidoglycan teichoic acid transferase
MQQRFDDYGTGSPPPAEGQGGFSARTALLAFAFCTFVLGGFAFGWLFMTNWRLLGTFQVARLPTSLPGVGVTVPQPPPGSTGIGRPKPTVVVPGTGDQVRLPTPEPAQQQEDLSSLPVWTRRVNILLLGIDHRDDEPIEGSRSDTIMVASIDPPSKSVVLVSFPRDMWVSIPGFYPQRINVAHAVGGPTVVASTIQANFGMKIDNFARVDFSGFEQVVDAVGGIIIDAERPVKDDEYPTEDYGVMRLFLPPGPILLDGKTALMFARSRHSESDFGRSRRQQQVLVALRERALQMGIVSKVPTLLTIANKAITTDLDPGSIVALGRLGLEMDRNRIKTLVVDESMAFPFKGPNGEDLLQPNRQAIQAAVLRASGQATGQTARVEVLNGTDRIGVARQLADQIARQGYEVTRVDDADRNDYPSTIIEVLNNNQQAATVLATRLRVPQTAIKVVPNASAGADLRVIVGRSQQP